MTVLIGIDAGLTTTRVVAFDAEGRELSAAHRRSPETKPNADWVERKLESFWKTVAEATREVVDDVPERRDSIAGVGVAGHGHGLYLLDEDGTPVRNAILSTDSRAADLVFEWEEQGLSGRVAATTGYEPFVADPLSLLGWLKRNERDSYDAIEQLLFCKDYLRYRLTDRVATDEMEASVFYDIERGEYDRDPFDALNISEAFDALPPVVESTGTAGSVTDEAAAETGLPAGTPVAAGLHDIGATALGAGVLTPGQALFVLGTWGQSIVVSDEPVPGSTGTDGTEPGIPRSFLGDRWLRYEGNRSAASCLDWFVEACCPDWKADGADPESDSYARYNRKAASVQPGANGLVFHPYLQGSTTEPDARGTFLGLTTDHTREDMLRAIYEGVAMAQCQRLDDLHSHTEEIRMAGGGARSEVWTQIFADVAERPVEIPSGTEPGALGAAICAGVATGLYETPPTATDRVIDVDRVHEPDKSRRDAYRTVGEIFAETSRELASTWNNFYSLRKDD